MTDTLVRQINIGPFTFDVQYKDGYIFTEGNLGACIPVEHQILISNSQDKRSKCRTIIHEAIEGWNAIYDVKLRHHQINQLEIFIYDLISSNPDLLDKIEEGINE